MNVALGDIPAKSCGPNQKLVHLSGGDITSVSAGAGLTGGSENGRATLELAPGQSLPQTCTNNQVPKWNGSGWNCGGDNNTTYSNGTGLHLTGTTFSLPGVLGCACGCEPTVPLAGLAPLLGGSLGFRAESGSRTPRRRG